MTCKHVVIAEDNCVLLDVIRFNLSRAGYQVTAAQNGNEAWNVIQSQGADLLITDCQMPELSGLELCEKIRSDKSLCNLPILFCTAKGFEISQSVLNELRLPQIICKPFSPRELVMRVDELLQPTEAIY
ncbi:MAG: response regulator [Planctomycetaceae bacterium]